MIKKMKPKDEIAMLKAQINTLRQQNHSLNMRATAKESPWQKERDRLAIECEMWRDCWHREFQRVGDAFDYIKQIYEVCAARVGKPFGRYHAVNDCSHRIHGEPYTVWANVYHNREQKNFRVLDVVKEAINHE